MDEAAGMDATWKVLERRKECRHRQEWENAPEAIQQVNTLQASEQTRDWGEANEGKSWNESKEKQSRRSGREKISPSAV